MLNVALLKVILLNVAAKIKTLIAPPGESLLKRKAQYS
jgi:hypothetical protein